MNNNLLKKNIMNTSPKTQKEYDQLCDETMAYFKKKMNDYPQITMYKSIYVQIWMIKKDLSENVRLDRVKDFQKYSLGAIAAKNFDEGDVYGDAIGTIDAMAFIYFYMPKDAINTPDEMLRMINRTIGMMKQPFEEYKLKSKYKEYREEKTPYIEYARQVLNYIKDYLEKRNDGSKLNIIDLEECANKTYLSFRYEVSFLMYEIVPDIINKLINKGTQTGV
jgi:hypothetical protein